MITTTELEKTSPCGKWHVKAYDGKVMLVDTTTGVVSTKRIENYERTNPPKGIIFSRKDGIASMLGASIVVYIEMMNGIVHYFKVE